MKKNFTLLVLAFTIFSLKSVAQTAADCNAKFTYAISGDTVKFIPAAGTDSSFIYHHWKFGDTSAILFAYDPTHIYPGPGTYIVTQYVAKTGTNASSPSCSDSSKDTITIVNDSCNIKPAFTWRIDTLTRTVYFTNTTFAPSTLAVPSTWFFGDDSSSNAWSATHTYPQPGKYYVCLRLQPSANCVKYQCDSITIPVPTCNTKASYTWKIDSLKQNTIDFTNTTILSPTLNPVPVGASIWIFGDGSALDSSWNATHTYAQPGKYYVCLRVQTAANCLSYQCDSVTVPSPVVCNLQSYFNDQPDSIQSNKIHFTDYTTNLLTTDSSYWTFGDSTTSRDVNPIHVYAQPGTYNACLTITRITTPGMASCVSKFCRTIVIQPVCNLTASFTYFKDSFSTSPYTYNFTNTSTPINNFDSSYWSFGDGTASYALNPTHIFSTSGTYTVCLYVKNAINSATATTCESHICETVVVAALCNIKVAYTWKIDSLNQNTVDFTNTTPLPISGSSAVWSFGDGTALDSTWNATHTYSQPGKYYVCLRIQTNNTCINYQCDSVTIPTPAVCNLQAYFNSTIDSLNYNIVHFHNYTTNLAATDSSYWTFGDGTTSYDINPTHSFADTGTYNVCLHLKRMLTPGTAPCASEYCRTVTITQPCNFKIGYTWALAAVNTNEVYFTNTSDITSSTASVRWSFGDGSSLDTTWNATHTFAQPGKYYVCLRIQITANCVKYQCDSVTVPAPTINCQQLSLFTFTTAATDSQYYIFTPTYPATNVQYTWTFGDNDGSLDITTTHHYANPGIYTACLTAYRDSNCASTTCKEIAVKPQPNCDSINIYYNYYQNGSQPNMIYFNAVPNLQTTRQSWTITSLANAATNPIILYGINPVYVFSDTGYYRVCLDVVTIAGCIKEYCNVIHIATIASTCELYVYPNPSHTQVNLNVQLSSSEMIYSYLYNSENMFLSQTNQQGSNGNNIVTINTENLAAGFYIIKLIYGNRTCYARFQKL